MKALKFNLSGETAFFKKPDVNTYLYFTYGNIHKVAVLGIVGAVLGLKGYNDQEKEEYPEFYKELSSLRIAIVPRNDRGYISKKVQIFNNSVGYASQEEGGNLIVKEQWLEKPEWEIYICLTQNPYAEEIESRFLNGSFQYVPYLGKNDHFANIKDIEVVELTEASSFLNMDSLFIKSYFDFAVEDEFEFSLEDLDIEEKWKYEEKLPISLEPTSNQYVTDSFIFTNMKLSLKEEYKLYSDNNRTLFFF